VLGAALGEDELTSQIENDQVLNFGLGYSCFIFNSFLVQQKLQVDETIEGKLDRVLYI
jgi:hypothetical protein